jgi:GDP-6-deoxy-D-talose 4-dehydrogenase
MGKSLLLTGSDGFTGQHFSSAARARSYEVYDLSSNLVNERDVAEELKNRQFDHVVHLAAIAAVTHEDEHELYDVNLFGTLNLLDALSRQATPPQKILLASSANVYGNAISNPICETTEAAPVNHYAMSKLAAEYLTRNYQDTLPITILRPFNYTGLGQDERFVIPKLIQHFKDRAAQIELGNISVRREFNDVRSICEIYLDLLDHAEAGEVYNICSGTTYCLSEITELLSRLTGHEIEIRVNPAFVRENEVYELCGDPKKLRTCLGPIEYRPLEETLQWMLTQGN